MFQIQRFVKTENFLFEILNTDSLCQALCRCRWKKKWASSEIENEQKTAGREKERVVSIFSNTSIGQLPNPIPVTISRLKMSNVKTSKSCSEGGYHMLKMFVRLRVRSQMIDVQCKCFSKLSQLTNHRVYQELVYQNEVFKQCLQPYRLQYSVSPQPPHGFCATFLDLLFSLLFSLSWSLKQANYKRIASLYFIHMQMIDCFRLHFGKNLHVIFFI